MQILWKFCPFCGQETDGHSTPPCPKFPGDEPAWEEFMLDLNLAISIAAHHGEPEGPDGATKFDALEARGLTPQAGELDTRREL